MKYVVECDTRLRTVVVIASARGLPLVQVAQYALLGDGAPPWLTACTPCSSLLRHWRRRLTPQHIVISIPL